MLVHTAAIIAAVEFGSPAMLGWLAAAALPWLINLWSRRRHVETPWAAVQLLLAAVRERSRRLRLREWLLLAMRTSILALAVLAAARPMWRQADSAGIAADRTHHVIVVDESFSMQCRDGDESRFERARQRARQIVEAASSGDAYTVIAWAEAAENVLGRATFEAADALAAIDALEPVDTIADLGAALRTAEAAIDATSREFPGLRRSRIALVSDMAAVTWATALPAALGAAGAAAPDSEAAKLWQSLSARAELVIESVDDGVRDNAAIIDMELDPPLPALDGLVAVDVRLQASGAHTWDDLSVELFLDGVRIGRRTADVKPGEASVVRFETRIIDRGRHVFEARLADDADPLDADNRRWLAAEIRGAARVICFVDVAGAAEDFARALNPRRNVAGEGGGIAVETANAASLVATDLSTYDAAIICNVAELAPREQRLLRRYAADGGAIIFVLGDRVRPDAYNELFAGDNSEPASSTALPAGPLLPVQLAAAPVEGDWRIDPLDYRHPVLAPFAGRVRAGLIGVRVSRYFPLSVDVNDPQVATAMGFTSGDPALVIGDYGLGRVAVLATDPALRTQSEPWSSFAISPSFLPLVRELFAYVATDRRSERLNRLAGEPITAPRSFLSGSAGPDIWKTSGGRETTTLPDTRQSGVYILRRESSQAAATIEAQNELSFAVNVDPRESDLATIAPQDLRGGPIVGAEGQSAAPLAYLGATPLAPALLAAAAVMLLLELLTAWSLGRGWA